MHAEPALSEQGDDVQSQSDSTTAKREVTTRFYGSLLDVLMPANPPEPKNARIVRRFDLEAARTDALPAASDARDRKTQERRSREEVRALRNRSLRAAAGLD